MKHKFTIEAELTPWSTHGEILHKDWKTSYALTKAARVHPWGKERWGWSIYSPFGECISVVDDRGLLTKEAALEAAEQSMQKYLSSLR